MGFTKTHNTNKKFWRRKKKTVMLASSTCKCISLLSKSKKYWKTCEMAKSSFEYVKNFELDDTLLPNTWIVIRLDGKCFHKFSDDHRFSKPNDLRALKLMNYAAYNVMKEFNELLIGFGQSDEYSFIFRKDCNLYKRRASKLLTTINSKFSTSYVFHWNKFFDEEKLLYPPTFDGRIVLYPSEEILIDYLKWRQADVHINNLYNTTFWTLVLKGNLSPAQIVETKCTPIFRIWKWFYAFASSPGRDDDGLDINYYSVTHSLPNILAEKRLCGTVSADKNEILFQEFQINYNNEPDIFKRGTILMRKVIQTVDVRRNVIADVHDDMLRKEFWADHRNMLLVKPSKLNLVYEGLPTDIINEQIN